MLVYWGPGTKTTSGSRLLVSWDQNGLALWDQNRLRVVRQRTHCRFLEGEEGNEKDRERKINVREKHQLVASLVHSHKGPNLYPRHVPYLRIKSVTFCSA